MSSTMNSDVGTHLGIVADTADPASPAAPAPTDPRRPQGEWALRSRLPEHGLSKTTRWLEEHMAASQLPTPWDTVVMIVGVAIIAGIATFDVLVDVQFSHSIVYVLPVVAVALLTSNPRGLVVAAASATGWVIADAMTLPRVHPASLVANHLIRLLSFAAVVGIIAVLRHALVRATAADLRSRRFLADAAHQLRTPIAGLQATAETLLMSAHTEQQETMLVSIAGTANRMGRLTNSLLQIARLDQGEMGAFRSVDVAALCRGEVDLLRHRCGPEVEVVFDAGTAPSDSVTLDPDATREALSNLLDNARRHARHRIDIGVVHHDDHLCLFVSDDGPGLPAGLVDAAFERFTSLDGEGGSGLGLPIARGYIERQGGDLSYRDGAFVIRLPR